jgi:hypothetical protein
MSEFEHIAEKPVIPFEALRIGGRLHDGIAEG